jgi:hypothetical protein
VRKPADTLRLYSSWRGLLLAFLSPALILLVAALAIVGSGIHAISLILLIVGAALLIVSLFDFPIYSTFDADGIRRWTPLRVHTIPWAKVTAISRARGARRKRAGPLAAAVGGRRYLLVDRTEGRDEYEALRKLCEDANTPLSAVAPDADVVPTWLYHRKRDPEG